MAMAMTAMEQCIECDNCYFPLAAPHSMPMFLPRAPFDTTFYYDKCLPARHLCSTCPTAYAASSRADHAGAPRRKDGSPTTPPASSLSTRERTRTKFSSRYSCVCLLSDDGSFHAASNFGLLVTTRAMSLHQVAILA